MVNGWLRAGVGVVCAKSGWWVADSGERDMLSAMATSLLRPRRIG
jgi:hypothetical protein